MIIRHGYLYEVWDSIVETWSTPNHKICDHCGCAEIEHCGCGKHCLRGEPLPGRPGIMKLVCKCPGFLSSKRPKA